MTAFYAQFHVGAFAGRANGQVDMTVKVTDASGAQLYSRDIHGTSQLTVELAGGGNAARAISAALSNATTDLFDDPAFVAALQGRAAASPG